MAPETASSIISAVGSDLNSWGEGFMHGGRGPGHTSPRIPPSLTASSTAEVWHPACHLPSRFDVDTIGRGRIRVDMGGWKDETQRRQCEFFAWKILALRPSALARTWQLEIWQWPQVAPPVPVACFRQRRSYLDSAQFPTEVLVHVLDCMVLCT